jgi:flagellar biosynthetic protein FliQ
MEPAEIFEICREAIYVLLVVSAPVMGVALVVGLIVSLFQTLTQVQEATLTFVPKILAVFLTLSIAMPFMLQHLYELVNRIQDKIVHIQ